jgi:hypothetical protein
LPKTKMSSVHKIKSSTMRQARHFLIITHSYCKMQSGRLVFKYSYCTFNIPPSVLLCVNSLLFKHSHFASSADEISAPLGYEATSHTRRSDTKHLILLSLKNSTVVAKKHNT